MSNWRRESKDFEQGHFHAFQPSKFICINQEEDKCWSHQPCFFLVYTHTHTHTPIFSAIFHPLYFYRGLFFAGVGVGQSIVQDKEGRAQAQPLLGNRAADVGVEMNGYSRFQCFLGFLKSARHL